MSLNPSQFLLSQPGVSAFQAVQPTSPVYHGISSCAVPKCVNIGNAAIMLSMQECIAINHAVIFLSYSCITLKLSQIPSFRSTKLDSVMQLIWLKGSRET